MIVVENGIALIDDDQCLCTFIKHHKRLDFDSHCYDLFLKRYLKPGYVVLDVGAFIGDTSLYLSRMVGDEGMVHCFEPFPESFRCMEYNLFFLKNCKLHNYALSNKSGLGKCNLTSKNYGMNTVDHEENGNIIIKTLDELELQPNFIKMDVEGDELNVLIGATETLNRCRPPILMELNRPMLAKKNTSRKELEEYLFDLKYVLRTTIAADIDGCVQNDGIFIPLEKYKDFL